MKILVNDNPYDVFPGPVLLLAGPGTGKTYQLAKRIQFLTSEAVNAKPNEITVITFTKEAAKSMRDKISQKDKEEYIVPEKRPKKIVTMHSLGNSIIKDNPEKANLRKDFKLIESEEVKNILMVDSALLLGFSEEQAQKALEDRSQANQNCSDESLKIIEKYEQLLRISNSIDHDDQIKIACQILEKNEEIKVKYLENTKYLLVDEYQDINEDQFKFIKLLTSKQEEGLFAVGDDDQSIYRFRGGSPKYIRSFEEHFGSNAKILQLEVSRRCLQNILDCANCLVAFYDKERAPKVEPKYIKEDLGEVFVHDLPSDEGEAIVISSLIKKEIDSAKDFRTFFILIPTKNYSQKIESKLKVLNLSYDLQKNSNDSFKKFFIVKGWIDNKESNILTRQVINLIIEGGGTTIPGSRVRSIEKKNFRKEEILKIVKQWEGVIKENKTFWEVLNEKIEKDKLFEDIVNKMKMLSDTYDDSLANFLKCMVDIIKPWTTKDKFFKEVMSILEASRNMAGGRYQIRILSMQASKGLEADTVFIVGLEEGSIPRLSTKSGIAESARLMFVAMTRAKEKLHITHCRTRDGSATFAKKSYSLQPSSFINCLPEEKIIKKYYRAR